MWRRFNYFLMPLQTGPLDKIQPNGDGCGDVSTQRRRLWRRFNYFIMPLQTGPLYKFNQTATVVATFQLFSHMLVMSQNTEFNRFNRVNFNIRNILSEIFFYIYIFMYF